ncbi:Monocopper oxidase-like protein SKU5 [Acorus gramineus]|uniref:Monocopper oxidase-like protein SKU5 n=1 Tax=Acorus gramineus TaxID=55184 RepID=A0AAV9ATT3_ACOGR|nr:Monocopper oxidase-like protein SKU5 [Acorus gramineus]
MDRFLVVFTAFALLLLLAASKARAADIFLEWNVAADTTIRPVDADQPVLTINGMFPGPLINSTTNDIVHVNVFNNLDEPLLFTWNGIQQRLNSWQDGVSGTNCPIAPGTNWTYVFQVKDQIGSYFYFLSTNFQKAGGGFGPLRINNRIVIAVPFPKPEAEFDLLIGDWYFYSYKNTRVIAGDNLVGLGFPHYILINGKPFYNNSWGGAYETIEVTQGKTYRLRISNVGSSLSFNFRVQNHQMVLVETEGSYPQQIVLDSLDVHVGQSYSVLITANQDIGGYYMVATPTQTNASSFPNTKGVGILRYANSVVNVTGPLPAGPDPLDREFSVNQSKSIRWNMTAGAARPNPQGTFNVSNVAINQTFILHGLKWMIEDQPRHTVNNVSYWTPSTPLKLADHFFNGTGVYKLDEFPMDSINAEASYGTSVVSGFHKGWIQLIFQNDLDEMDAWHLDGFGFYVVGFGDGKWSPESRSTYNLLDPVLRSTVQVYPGGWSAVYAFLDNPGMWNLRSQRLENWYLGQEMYIRVFDSDPNPIKERPPPDNVLLCGLAKSDLSPSPSPAPAPCGYI